MPSVVKIVCCCLIVTLCTESNAQNIGELRDSLASLLHDTVRVSVLNDLSKKYWNSDIDTARLYANEALELSNTIDYPRGKCRSLNYLGIAYTNSGDFEKALSYLNQANSLSDQLNDLQLQSGVLTSLGILYRKMSHYPKAVSYYLEVLEILEKLGNDTHIAITLMNIGNVNQNMSEYDSAMAYYQKSSRFFEQVGHEAGLSIVQNNLGNVLFQKGEYQQAISSFEKSLHFKKDANNLYGMALAEVNMAQAFTKLDSLHKAERLYKAALIHFDSAGVTADAAHAYQGLAEVYKKMGHPEKSFLNAQRALQLSGAGKLMEVEKVTHNLLSQYYEQGGQWKNALSHFKQYHSLADSLFNETNIREVERIKSDFQLEKKEQEIRLLTAKNELAASEVKLRNRQMFFIIVAIILIVLSSLSFIIFQKQKHKLQNKLLSAEINELRAKINSSLIEQGNSLEVPLDEFNGKVHNALTEREFEILKLAISKKTNSQIADEVFVSVNTVKFHLKNIFNKLGVANRLEALEFVTQKST